MKIFRRILLIILCVALVVISIGFLLPGKIHVERTMKLNASQRTIFNQVNSLKNWESWFPWFQQDTTMEFVFSGPVTGVGAALKWMSTDRNVGNGSVSIISSFSSDSLEVIFDFAEKGKSTEKFIFLKEDRGTNVICSIDSDLGMNPLSRWVGLFSDQLIGPDIDQGLFNLEQIVRDTKNIYGYEITDYEVPAQILISVRDTASTETVTYKLALMYKNISHFLKSKNLSPVGNPMAVFHNYSNRNFDIEAGLPVHSVIAVPEGMQCSEKAVQRTVMISYIGSYKMISSAYEAIQSYINDNGLQMNGPVWEEYITNPTIEADPNKQQTNIYYPVN